jgi:serine/threonine-protein kinase
MADVFAMQDEIAAAIAAALQVKLADRSGAPERHVPKLPAYEAYLKARHHLWRVSPEAISSATEFYRQAIALDPEFALAYVAFADCWFGYSYSGIQPAHVTMPQAREWARKALAIDPSLQEAHDLLCFVATVYDYDWEEAGRQFRPATPEDSASRFFRALYAGPYLQLVGRREEALEELRRAVDLDPLHPVQRVVLSMILVQNGKLEEAAVELRRILDLDPTFFWAYEVWANIHALRSEWIEALACAEKAHSLAPWRPQTTGVLSGMLARTGDTTRAEELLRMLGDGKAYGAPLGLAAYSYYAGDLDQCANWVEKAIEQRHPAVLASELLVLWRSTPRWPALARMMNLPPEAL